MWPKTFHFTDLRPGTPFSLDWLVADGYSLESGSFWHLHHTEAEFMNVQFRLGFLANLESSQNWGFRIQCLYNKPDSTHFPTFAQGVWGVKLVSIGDCEYQGGKILRLFSQLRPRIWPQVGLLGAVGLHVLAPSSAGQSYNFQGGAVGWGGGE